MFVYQALLDLALLIAQTKQDIKTNFYKKQSTKAVKLCHCMYTHAMYTHIRGEINVGLVINWQP